MGAALDEYLDNLEDTKLAYSLVSTGLGRTNAYLDKLLAAVKSAEKTIDKAKNLDDFVDDLGKVLLVLKSFPPLKALAKVAEKVVKSAEKKSGEFLEDLEDLQREIDKFETRIKDAKAVVSDQKRDFDADKADLSAAIPGIEAIQAVFQAADLDAPASLSVLEDNADNLLAALNTQFPQERLQALVDNITATTEALAALAPMSEVFDIIAAAFEKTLSKVSFLDGPLDGLVDALDGFLWVLEKIDSIISFVLDPIIDPILSATGLDDLIEDLADSITSLLPDIDLLDPFANLGADLTALFGSVENPASPLDITFIQTFLDAKNTLFGLLYGEAGFLAPLFAEGTDGFDILVGRPGVDLGFIEFGSNFEGGDTGDILIGGRASDVLNGGAGNDLIIATGGEDIVDGGAGDEDIFATVAGFADYSYTLIDNGPDDRQIILTYQGADTALLGSTEVTNVEFLIFAGTTFSFDTLAAAITGSGIINGTELPDLIFGSDGADTINGLGGDDRITGFGGQDVIDGGAGNDTVDYSAEDLGTGFLGVTANLDPNGTQGTPSDDTLINIENVVGTDLQDLLLGNDEDNRLTGRAGGDYIAGFGGDDILSAGFEPSGTGGFNTLAGGDGNDVLISGNTGDIFVGGRGNDTYRNGAPGVDKIDQIYYGTETSGFIDFVEDYLGEDFAAGWPDYIIVRVLGDNLVEVEKVYADVTYVDTLEGNFVINGTPGIDTFELRNVWGAFDGGDGDDLFIGYIPDTAERPEVIWTTGVLGGNGNDRLISFSGDESFSGGNGNDTVELRITRGNDHAPDYDTLRFGSSTQENVDGPRLRTLDGNADFDTLDVSQSDLDWVMVYGVSAFGVTGTLISTTDNSVNDVISSQIPDNRKDYNDLASFDQLDLFEVRNFEQFIGSDAQEAIYFEDAIDLDFSFVGNGGNDYFWGTNNSGNMTLDMGDGDDEVTTGQGVDTVTAGAGNDSIWVYGNAAGTLETVDAGAGNDYVAIINDGTATGTFTFAGGTGQDLLDFGEYASEIIIDLQAGTFDIAAGSVTGSFSGFEAVIGGDRQNTITGDDTDNISSGGEVDDTIYGGGGNDILYTGTGPQSGDIGEDFIYAGAGNDLIFAPSGRGVLDGGDDFDTVRFAGFLTYSETSGYQTTYDGYLPFVDSANWVIDLDAGTANETVFDFFSPSGTSAGSFTLIDIESVIGGLWDDTMYARTGFDTTLDGFDGNDDLYGRDGNDTLIGGRGDDRLFGNAGDDVLIVGSGDNEAHGGIGFDTLDLRFGASDITIDAQNGTASYTFEDSFPLLDDTPVSTSDGSVSFSGIENFGLSEGDDSFQGSIGADTVRGWGGDDVITGGGGADTLYGGGGNDTIYGAGGGGSDAGNYIDGGGGDDLL